MEKGKGKKEKQWSMKQVIIVVAFGVLLYAVVMNPDIVSSVTNWLLAIIFPILLGLLFALVLNVPMRGFEHLLAKLDKKNKLKPKTKQTLALVMAVLVVPLVLMVLIIFIVPQFVEAVRNVIAIVKENESAIAAFVERIGLSADLVMEQLDNVGSWVSDNIGNIAGATVSTAVDVVSTVFDAALGLILAIYMLLDKAALKRRVKRTAQAILPERIFRPVYRFTSMFISTFCTFLTFQCLEALILGALVLVATTIFRIPYALTLACMAAVFQLIPYVGAFLSLTLGVILVVTVSPIKALIFAAIMLLSQQVEGNLIYPRVVGQSVGLPPYITLIAIMVGGALAGIFGMFFVIPFASVTYTLLREYVHNKLDHKEEQAVPDAQELESPH